MILTGVSYLRFVDPRMNISAGRTTFSDGDALSLILVSRRRTASSAIVCMGLSTVVMAGETSAAILVPDMHAMAIV